MKLFPLSLLALIAVAVTAQEEAPEEMATEAEIEYVAKLRGGADPQDLPAIEITDAVSQMIKNLEIEEEIKMEEEEADVEVEETFNDAPADTGDVDPFGF